MWRCLAGLLFEAMQHVDRILKGGDVEDAVRHVRLDPDLSHARSNAGHRFPIVRIEAPLHLPELKPTPAPCGIGKCLKIAPCTAQPHERLIRTSQYASFCIAWSTTP